MTDNKSYLEQMRLTYRPKLPVTLRCPVRAVEGEPTHSVDDQEAIKALFPCTYGMPQLTFERDDSAMPPEKPFNVGVILSGGQAPGGHNVICGLYDGIKALNKYCRLYGFLGGPNGLVKHRYIELTEDIIEQYRNTGGFDMIGSGRTKLETPEQFEAGLSILRELKITAVVIIGGDDSNTNAAVLAEYYKAHDSGVQVIGVPKTIDGDLKNEHIEISFGFDTATKVYSELIGNVARDCNSAKKYWHFMKLMGRSASHIALECALQTRPNYCIISEEVEARNLTLHDIAEEIADIVIKRHDMGMDYGTVLVPEGIVEFVPAMKKLIAELNEMLTNHPEISELREMEQNERVRELLSEENRVIYDSLPDDVARQLALDRDEHGNVMVSQIESERLLSRMVGHILDVRADAGEIERIKFKTQHHFFGYEGRCSFPSNFDADYCYSLGYNASHLIFVGATGYMSAITHLGRKAQDWVACGVPITMMMNMERRSGKDKPVIRKALVDLEGAPFKHFVESREQWALETCYIYPGPIQFFGPEELVDKTSYTLFFEQFGKE